MYKHIKSFIESSIFQNFIISLIILNGITMGLSTSKNITNSYGEIIELFDIFVISIFTIEIILRIYINRLSFFKDGWSLFDFTIVTVSLVPSSSGFEILRILRVLRLLRLITVIPQMRKIVTALINVIPGMASVAALVMLFFYIFAIMAVQLYGNTFPHWFGTLGESFYTLFQIMTLESWSMGIVRPIMEVHQYAWMFFVPFIFIVTFIMINLIIAVVVDAMAEMNAAEEEKLENDLKNEVNNLRSEIYELKELILKQNKRD